MHESYPVAIQMLPKAQWTCPARVLKIREMEEREPSGVTRITTEGGDADSDDGDEGDDTDSLSGDIDEVVAEEREIAQSIGHVHATEIMPTARVVGIIRRNWREYCGVLMASQVLGARR